MLENCPAILHGQHPTATSALGVFCSDRATRGFDFGERGLRQENEGESEMDWGAHAFRVLANASSRSRTFL
jgi:hypothetical protein